LECKLATPAGKLVSWDPTGSAFLPRRLKPSPPESVQLECKSTGSQLH